CAPREGGAQSPPPLEYRSPLSQPNLGIPKFGRSYGGRSRINPTSADDSGHVIPTPQSNSSASRVMNGSSVMSSRSGVTAMRLSASAEKSLLAAGRRPPLGPKGIQE